MTLMWYYIVRGCLGAVIITGNTLVIFLIICSKQLHNTTSQFILSLSLADLSVGLFLIPAYFICIFVPDFECKMGILKTSFSVILYVSIGNLCILTADRYISIVYSLKYRMIMTSRMKIKLIAMAWVIPSFGALAPEIWLWISKGQKTSGFETFFLCIICVFEVLPCVLMAFIYLRITLISRQLSQKTNHLQMQLAFNNNGGSCTNRKRQNKEKSPFYATLIVVLLFISTWLFSAYRTFCVHVLTSCHVAQISTLISRLMMLTSCSLNPFIWALLNKDIKKELVKLLQHCRKTRPWLQKQELPAFRVHTSNVQCRIVMPIICTIQI